MASHPANRLGAACAATLALVAADVEAQSANPQRAEPAAVLDARALHVQESALDSLVRAELAFARLAGERGISPAFMAFFAPDGVVFQPGPVNARQTHAARPAPPDATLKWHPRIAAVAAAGDLGFTSGPWTAGGPDNPAAAHGHFVSVWRKSHGRWEVVADIGIGHDPLADQGVQRGAQPIPLGRAGRAPADTASLLEANSRFGASASDRQALQAMASPDIRVYRVGDVPASGPAALLASPPPQDATWDVAGSGVAASGDFGYTYGTVKSPARAGAPATVTNFLRLWTRDAAGGWVVLLDLLSGTRQG